MKAKYALMALLAILFWRCDDNTGELGLSIFPNSDQNIKGRLSTFDVVTSSIPAGRIYAMTNMGYVGKFTDKLFGTYEAGFLTTLNCPQGLQFPGVYTENAFNENGNLNNIMTTTNDSDIRLIYNNEENAPIGDPIGNIYTVEFYLWYNSFFGDSINVCRLSAYELNKKLDLENEPYYTDIDPTEFYDSNDLLATKAYTAVDFSLSDSVRNLDNYVPYVHFELDKETAYKIGGDILRASRNAGSNFNNDIFSDIFKGIYVKNDYGDGTILYVFQVQMNVVYKCYAVDETTGVKLKKASGGADSTYYSYRSFASTREVLQANQLQNDKEKINELIKQDYNTYIKSPAGIFTQATLPIKEISDELYADSLNAVSLTFSNYNQSNEEGFELPMPSTLMLIRKKYKDTFFEENQLPDETTSFLSSHNSSTNQYTFSNITNLINNCLAEREAARVEIEDNHRTISLDITDKSGNTTTKEVSTIEEWEQYSDWDKVVLIPVSISYNSSTSSSSSQIISVQHDLGLGYVRLKGGERGESDPAYRLKLEVVSTKFE